MKLRAETVSELCDGPAGRTVTGTTNRREPPFQTLQLLRIWYRERVCERRDGSAGRTVTCVTDRHMRDGPSQTLWWKLGL